MKTASIAQIFQRKLIQWILVPGMLMAVIIISIIGYNQLKVQEREIVHLSRSLAKNVVFYMDGAEDVLRSVALVSGNEEFEQNHIYFKILRENYSRFERLILLDKNENIVAVAPEGIKGVDFPIRFANPDQGGYVLTSPIISLHSGKLVVYISIPVDGGGRLVAELSLDALQDFIHGFLSSDRVIMLTDAYGNLIVHPDRELVRNQANVGGLEIFSGESQPDSARFYKSGDGLFFGVMSKIPGTGWKLVVACSAGYFIKPIATLGVLVTVFILIIFLVLLIALKKEFRSSVILPMTSYIRKLSDIARGEYPTESSHGNEFLELDEFGKVFDGMSIKVREREYDLQVSKNFFQSVIDSMPSVLVWVDDDMMVRQCNEKAHEVFGVSAEISPVAVDEYFSGQKELSEVIFKAIKRRSPQVIERRRLFSAEDRLYDITIFPLLGSEKKGVVVRMDDVTARVRMEETMVQTEKMISVGGLAAGMAHEINNPIGGILQGAQNLERKFSAEIKANVEASKEAGCSMESLQNYYEIRRIKSVIKGIREAGVRAAGIVSNMLDFSRPGTSQISRVDIIEILEASLNLAAKDYDLKKKYDFLHIKIVRDYEHGLPAVLCSRTEIEQVLFNLFKNSAQAISEHGYRGEQPEIRIRTRAGDQRLVIEVEDNGPGIKPEVRRRIFEPFFTTKSAGIGTGLGLSVSYFIITQNHGGTFVADNSFDGGARFVITIPYDKTENEYSE